MSQPDSNSTFTIQDAGGRPIQCQAGPGINVYTADALNGACNQDWYISDPNNTVIAGNPSTTTDPSFPALMLGVSSVEEGADVLTFTVSTYPSAAAYCWQCNDDGSIELLNAGSASGYFLNSFVAGATNQLKVSKNTAKQTWAWNKKLSNGGPGTA